MPTFNNLPVDTKIQLLSHEISKHFNCDIKMYPAGYLLDSFCFVICFNNLQFKVFYKDTSDRVTYCLQPIHIPISIHYTYISKVKDILLAVVDKYSITNIKSNKNNDIGLHFLLSLGYLATIKNFMGSNPEKEMESIIELIFYVDDTEVKLCIDLNTYKTMLSYHCKLLNGDDYKIVYKRIYNPDIFSMFEQMFYDIHFRDKYQLGKRTKRKLELIEILQK